MKTLIATLAVTATVAIAAVSLTSPAFAGRGNSDRGWFAASQSTQPGQTGPSGKMGRGAGRMATPIAATQARLDTNQDGSVSRDEFVSSERPGRGANTDYAKSNRTAQFDRLDTNKDGTLSPSELPSAPMNVR